MEKILKFIFQNFSLIWGLTFVWVLGGFAFRDYLNRRKGLYFEDPSSSSILYSESGASGRSHKSILTRSGGASNCLKIQVTSSHLYIRPFFPFIILGPHFDLIHVIPVYKIKKVESASGSINKGTDIVFTNENGENAKLTIVSKRTAELIAILTELSKANTQSVGGHNSGD